MAGYYISRQSVLGNRVLISGNSSYHISFSRFCIFFPTIKFVIRLFLTLYKSSLSESTRLQMKVNIFSISRVFLFVLEFFLFYSSFTTCYQFPISVFMAMIKYEVIFPLFSLSF